MQSWSRNPSLLKNTPIFCLGTTRFTASEAQQTGIHMVTKVLKAGAADVVGAHVEPMWFHRLEKKNHAFKAGLCLRRFAHLFKNI